MQTRHLILHSPESAQAEEYIREAATLLRQGRLVAFPTETVYGLGANAFDPAAVAAIFHAKQRPAWDPLIVHVTDDSMLRRVVLEIPARAQELIRRFWPGPLTLLLPRSAEVPETVTAGRAKVAVRMPAHPVARALIHRAEVPIAAPSANLFGRPSPTTAAHVLSDLGGRIDAILDYGPTPVGLESTVLDVTELSPIVYRAGAVSAEELRAVLGDIRLYAPPGQTAHDEPPQSLPSPGAGIRHYAPAARLVLTSPQQLIASAERFHGRRVGIMLPTEIPASGLLKPGTEIFSWGSLRDPAELARNLFAGLRLLDEKKVEIIFCPLPIGQQGLFAAIRDRLLKAARETQDCAGDQR